MTRFFYALISFLLVFMLINFVPEYLTNHQYYSNFLNDPTNIKVLLGTFFASCIPLCLIFLKRKSLWLGMGLFFLGLIISNIWFLSTKGGNDSLLGNGGFFGLIANFGVVSIIAFYFLLSLWGAGDMIMKKIFKRDMIDTQDYIFSFGAGMVAFLSINYFLALSGLLYPIISFLLFLVGGVCIRKSNILSKADILLNRFSLQPYNSNIAKAGIFLACIMVLMYIYLSWLYAYIPYSTAWDANHAYMFYPKIWALNHGIYWADSAWTPPYMWFSYISYWFSIAPIFKINADTLGVFMNNISGIYVILFFAGLLGSISKLMPLKNHTRTLFVVFGMIAIIAWLTSGMGAFLVFVDNKTDLGVLFFTILSLFVGSIVLQKIQQEDFDNINLYAIICGIFFGFAALAKPTAMIDVVAFAVLFSSMLFSVSGGVGIALATIGVLAISKVMGIDSYLSTNFGLVLILLGIALFAGQFIFQKHNLHRLKLFVLWGATFFGILVIFKLPYIVGNNLANQKSESVVNMAKGVLLGKNNSTEIFDTKNSGIFCAGTVCPALDSGSLYQGLKPLPNDSFSEDVGRYVGYGNKDFSIKSDFFKNVFSTTGSYETTLGQICYSFISGANSGFPTQYSQVLTSLPSSSLKNEFAKFFTSSQFLKQTNHYYEFNPTTFPEVKSACQSLSSENTICDQFLAGKISNAQDFSDTVSQDTTAKQIFASFLASSGFVQALGDKVYYSLNDFSNLSKDCNQILNSMSAGKPSGYTTYSVPYKWIIPFNISFNWSLQNESSYYTDIGYIWLPMIILVGIGLIYTSIRKYKFLNALFVATLFAWVMWFFIGGGILWYGIGLIIWTIISFGALIFVLKDDIYENMGENIYVRYGSYTLVLLVLGMLAHQLILNFYRMATYQPSGPFLWFKTGVGQMQDAYQYDDTTKSLAPLTGSAALQIPYTSSDIFNLQFPHYNSLINLVNNRDVNNEGVFLAGTYARYFFTSQKNIIYDQFLESMWQWFSDNDSCKSWLRLLDKKIKYIAIDPNIGTVVQGAGNSSLFDRFYGQIQGKKISQYGALTMLAQLVEDGKVKLVYTNNLVSKYAYIMPDDFIISTLGTGTDVGVVRANLSIFRYCSIGGIFANYCSYSTSELQNLISSYIAQRISSFDIVQDIADAQGKTIDMTKMLQFKDLNIQKPEFNNLSYDERMVLMEYYQIKNNPSYFQSILMDSIGSQSQIVVWEVEK